MCWKHHISAWSVTLLLMLCSFSSAHLLKILKTSWDIPGGPLVKNLPCSAGDVGLILGLEIKITHAIGQLRPPNKY